MRRIASGSAVALLVLLAACSRNVEAVSEPAPSASLDPVGTYDFSISMGGQSRSGTIVISRVESAYAGYATLEGEEESAPVRNVRVSGNVLTLEVEPPSEEAVTMELTFTGTQFTGNLFASGQSIPITGSKRAN